MGGAHPTTACPVAQSSYCGICASYGHTVGECPDHAVLEHRVPQYVEQLIPHVVVRARRVGGSVYQIPVKVHQDRAEALALRWLVKAAATRNDETMGKRLAKELQEAVEGRGNAVKKKVDVHKMAEANRAFSHFAW